MAPTSPPDIREQLFQAAVSQFRERGYSRVPVSGITREAGVAKGTFFNHFPTKDHILAEAFHRAVNEAFGEVSGRELTGTDAIMAFVRTLAGEMARDRELAEALVTRLSRLPAPSGEEGFSALRDEERIRSWVEARLAETLPKSVPLVEIDPALLAFLVTWALLGTLDEWVRSGDEEAALATSLRERIGYLLESSGLPGEAP